MYTDLQLPFISLLLQHFEFGSIVISCHPNRVLTSDPPCRAPSVSAFAPQLPRQPAQSHWRRRGVLVSWLRIPQCGFMNSEGGTSLAFVTQANI